MTGSFQCTRCPDYQCGIVGEARCGCDCGYVLSPLSATCLKCPDNCNFCTEDDPSKCFACRDGSFLTPEKKCAACVPNCRDCDSTSTCGSCQAGYRESTHGTYCLLVPENCSHVADTGKCSECLDGYGFDENGACRPCLTSKCDSCSKDYSVCESCSRGYGFDEKGACRPCLTSKCDSCSKEYSVCESCSSGYGFTTTPGRRECRPCRSKNCLYCSANYAVCTYCKDKYALGKSFKGTGGSCLKCRDHCDRCHVGTPGRTICDFCECRVQACFGFDNSTGLCTRPCKPCSFSPCLKRDGEGCDGYLACCDRR